MRDVDLAPETFQEGVLGGPVRDREIFDRLLETLLDDLDLTEASMVLPDSWLRIVPIDAVEGLEEDEDVLRWRLKKLVPFNVDGLRVRGVEGFAADTMLLAFAIEQLVADLEDAFAARGIRIGFIASRSQCLAAALRPTDELRSVILLAEDGYSLVVARAAETLLMRYKNLDPFDLDDELQALVRRDLANTRRLLDEELGEGPLTRSLVCGPEECQELWLTLVEESLRSPALPLGAADLRAREGESDPPWHLLVPMLGVAATEVT